MIKKDDKEGGKLEFGTEVVNSADGSLAVLLGASPGASTAVSIMLDVIERCFAEQMQSEAWKKKLRDMIPSYGQSLNDNPQFLAAMREHTSDVLGLVN